ncbi:hypothetical protein UFOVP1290_254 [uncultured Caudovirales phage]|uniref:Uncharacterized protein n=1 Tax=uncultured Caudovirales phage TaxID=2100421 RepID=A0A6J5RXJ4_9CAUD|nr:hypothetical protein UFOVP1290_254 [uncultured Caudovirales phage]
MKYRVAKFLQTGDQVTLKSDQSILTIKTAEVFGQYKKVLFHCVNEHNESVSVYNDHVE